MLGTILDAAWENRTKQSPSSHEAYLLLGKVKVLLIQSCPTLCCPVDRGPPGSFVRGILQARILERVASPFSRGFSDPVIEPRCLALQADSLPSEPG